MVRFSLAERHANEGRFKLKPKHVALLMVLAVLTPFVYLEVRSRLAASKVANRSASDREIHAYFEATVKPALSSATGEPATLARPILPVVPAHEEGLARVDTKLDVGVYNRLEPSQRTDQLSGAGSIAIVERSIDGFYTGRMAAGGSVSSSAVVTVFDVKTRSIVGKLAVKLKHPPPAEATSQMVDEYRDWFAGTVAAHLQALPP